MMKDRREYERLVSGCFTLGPDPLRGRLRTSVMPIAVSPSVSQHDEWRRNALQITGGLRQRSQRAVDAPANRDLQRFRSTNLYDVFVLELTLPGARRTRHDGKITKP